MKPYIVVVDNGVAVYVKEVSNENWRKIFLDILREKVPDSEGYPSDYIHHILCQGYERFGNNCSIALVWS